jgi:O-antigen/teichoic acid export membrane protein
VPDAPSPQLPSAARAPVPARDVAIRRRVLVATSANVLGTGFRLLVWFVLTPFILGLLGPVAYGVWVVVGSIAAYGSLLDMGLTPALVKYVAEHVARGDPAGAGRVIATAVWLYILLGLVAFAVFLAIAPWVPDVLSIPAGQRGAATAVTMLTGLSLAIGIPSTAAPSVLMGLQRYDAVNAISTASTLAGAAATVIVLALGGGVVGMVAANIPVLLGTTAVTIVVIRRVRPDLGSGLGRPNRALVLTMAAYGSSSFAYQISNLLQRKTDELVVGGFLAVALVAPYSIGRRVSDLVIMVTQQFMNVLLPLASELHAEGDANRLRAVYLTATRLGMALSLPVGTTIIVLAAPFITTWVGPDMGDAVPITIILAISSMVALTQWPAGAIFQGMARHRPLAVGALLTGLANLLLSVVLVQRMGIIGVALGTLIPTTLETLLFVLPYTTRRLGISLGQVVRSCLVPAGLPVIPSMLLTYALRVAVAPSNLVAVALIGAAGAATYAVGYLIVGAGPLERDLLRQVLARMRRRARPSPAAPGPPVDERRPPADIEEP